MHICSFQRRQSGLKSGGVVDSIYTYIVLTIYTHIIFTIIFYTYILGKFFAFLDHVPTYFLCKIGYSNIPRPVHDPLRLATTPSPKSWGRDTQPPGLTPMTFLACVYACMDVCMHVYEVSDNAQTDVFTSLEYVQNLQISCVNGVSYGLHPEF